MQSTGGCLDRIGTVQQRVAMSASHVDISGEVPMRKMNVLLVAGALVALGLTTAGTVAAAPQGPYTCTGGAIPAGTYGAVVVTGTCTFTGDLVTINGGLTVADGAVLNDHAASRTTVRVNGGVYVGVGAVLGLGAYGPPGVSTDTRVNGGIVANSPLSLYLSGITVNGGVVSTGGVAPAFSGALSEFRNFPFKDNTVNGGLTIQGWQGGWIGVIRNHINGDVNISDNRSVLVETPSGCSPEPGGIPCTGSAPGTDGDSTEVQTNVIHGSLACFDNTPPAQVNILDGGQLNQVTGTKSGECADL
jgi:hypothetical protein